jgi:tetratricopeptide (TPR) repeat protein
MAPTPSSPDERPGLERRVDLMKQEIDALQIQVMKDRGPWYKRISLLLPVVISVAAFLLALTTTILGESRLQREEEHSNSVELRQLTQRLLDIPAEHAEALRQYSDDPALFNQVGAGIVTEQLVLSSQAVDLISELDGDVTAAEYLAVSMALGRAGLAKEQQALVEQGINEIAPHAGEDPQGYLALLRARAQSEYLLGNVDEGRRVFQEALDAYESFGETNPYVVANSQAYTEYTWSESERLYGNCAVAEDHVKVAQTYLPRVTSPYIHTQVPQLAQQIRNGCPSAPVTEPIVP